MNPVILYPVGGGGQWLSNLIYALHSKEFAITPSKLNFHDKIWRKTDLVNLQHWSDNLGPTLTPHTFDAFVSQRTQFISFINAYVKRWPYVDLFTTLSPTEQFFYLTNDAKWRMGSDPMFKNLYLDHIALDTDELFLTPKKFAKQLFELLDRYNIEYASNLEFVLQSIDNFKATCKPAEHFGNAHSLGWQAWCHALTLEHNIPVDVTIREDFNGFIEFVDCHNEQFQEMTQEHFLVEV